MGKYTHDDVLDGGLNIIKNNANQEILCSAQPTTRTEAVTTYALAAVSIDSGDMTLGDGDVSGRKLTVAAQESVSVSATGDGTHVALVDDTRLLNVTTLGSTVSVVSGGTVDIAAYDACEINDPS